MRDASSRSSEDHRHGDGRRAASKEKHVKCMTTATTEYDKSWMMIRDSRTRANSIRVTKLRKKRFLAARINGVFFQPYHNKHCQDKTTTMMVLVATNRPLRDNKNPTEQRYACKSYIEAFQFFHRGRQPNTEREWKSLPVFYYQFVLFRAKLIKIQAMMRGFLARHRYGSQHKNKRRVTFDLPAEQRPDVRPKAKSNTPNKTVQRQILEIKKVVAMQEAQQIGSLLEEKKAEYLTLKKELDAQEKCHRHYPSTCMPRMKYAPEEATKATKMCAMQQSCKKSYQAEIKEKKEVKPLLLSPDICFMAALVDKNATYDSPMRVV